MSETIEKFFKYDETAEKEEYKLNRAIDELIEKYLKKLDISAQASYENLASEFECSEMTENNNMDDYIQFLDSVLIPNSMNVASPNYMGHMTSSLPYIFRPLSKLLVALNQNVVKVETSKVFTLLERQCLAIVHKAIYGYSEQFYLKYIQNNQSALGIFTSGGSGANLTGLWAARNSVLGPLKNSKGCVYDGLTVTLQDYGYKRAVVVGSSAAHYSIAKAVDILGLGQNNYIKVPLDNLGRMDCQELINIIHRLKEEKSCIIAVVAIAGSTETGVIDPLEQIGYICKNEKLFYHIDAAWGGPILFSEKHRNKLKGIELADSVAMDGHKQFYLPLGIGFCFFSDPLKANFIKKTANYIIREDSDDLGKYSLDGSRQAICLYLHAALYLFGIKGYGCLIDDRICFSRHVADIILGYQEFELIYEPYTNIILYRYILQKYRGLSKEELCENNITLVLNHVNDCIQEKQLAKGKFFVSRTRINYGFKDKKNSNISVLRMVICNPRITDENVYLLLEDQIIIGKEIEAEVEKEKEKC